MKITTASPSKYSDYITPVVIASLLYLVEYYIPKLPWFRLGLANTVILILIASGWRLREILTVSVLRVITAGIITGSIISPVILLSFCSSTGAVLVMLGFYRAGHRYFSLLSVSVVGAITNIGIQLFLASLILLHNFSLLSSMPIFMIYALLTGLITGYIAISGYNYIEEKQQEDPVTEKKKPHASQKK